MNNLCEVCGAECTGEVCEDCAYRMASKDSSDIWDRVQKFDNTPYEIDSVKNDICKHFKCNPDDINIKSKQPYTDARHLFMYVLIKRFNFRQVDVGKMFNLTRVQHCTVNYICKKYDKKFQSNYALNKFLKLLKY